MLTISRSTLNTVATRYKSDAALAMAVLDLIASENAELMRLLSGLLEKISQRGYSRDFSEGFLYGAAILYAVTKEQLEQDQKLVAEILDLENFYNGDKE